MIPISKFSHLSNSWNAGSWLNSTLTFCDKDCPNIGYDRDLSFSDCGSACEDKEGCNAFNFHENPPNCYLRKCPIPAPNPTWNFASDDEFLPNFDGYYWTKSDDKFFEDSQCPNIDSRSGLSITECIDECNEERGCTAVNYAQRQENFFYNFFFQGSQTVLVIVIVIVIVLVSFKAAKLYSASMRHAGSISQL